MKKPITCKECKDKESTGYFYYCMKRKWLIEKKLGNSQRMCDDEK